MDLEELQRRWEDHDRKLDASIRLNARLLQASVLGRAQTAMRRLSRLVLFELLADLLAPLLLGAFIAGHAAQVRFLVPALVLDLCAIALVAARIHQLAAIGRIDYGAPIVTIQKRLASLRAERIRTTQLTLLFAPLLWTPLLIVSLEAFAGLDAYAAFGAAWLAANLLAGLAVIPLALWISRRFAGRMERSPFVQRLMRDLAGYSLAAAAGVLQSLASFEEEEQEGRA